MVVACALLLSSLPAFGPATAARAEGTGRAASLQASAVTLDPVSGQPVAVWSQSDGSSRKIAYARLVMNTWNDFHYVTFGPGEHTEPRLVATRDGAYLFWITNKNRYMYASIDLASGRLHAAPRRLPLAQAGLRVLSPRGAGAYNQDGGADVPVVVDDCAPGSPDCIPEMPAPNPLQRLRVRMEGGSDVPVVVDCPPENPDCASGDASILPPGRRLQILTEGGTDVPVVVDCPPEDPDCASGDASILPPGRRLRILSEGGTDVPVVSGYTALWRVFSREACPLVVLTIPDVPRGGAIVLKFNTSDTQAAGRIRLTRGRSAELLSSAAMSILDGGCF